MTSPIGGAFQTSFNSATKSASVIIPGAAIGISEDALTIAGAADSASMEARNDLRCIVISGGTRPQLMGTRAKETNAAGLFPPGFNLASPGARLPGDCGFPPFLACSLKPHVALLSQEQAYSWFVPPLRRTQLVIVQVCISPVRPAIFIFKVMKQPLGRDVVSDAHIISLSQSKH
jgi:hypothetical protein